MKHIHGMNGEQLKRYRDMRRQATNVVGVALGLSANAVLFACYLLSKLDKINIFEL